MLLRDPVERFRCGRTLAENRLTVGSSPRAAANAGFQRGVYADQLLRLWRAFPREQVLVLQFERCVRDPLAELRRTFAFLGLDPDVPPGLDVRPSRQRVRGPKVDLSAWTADHAGAPLRAGEPAAGGAPGDDLDLSLWACREPADDRLRPGQRHELRARPAPARARLARLAPLPRPAPPRPARAPACPAN